MNQRTTRKAITTLCAAAAIFVAGSAASAQGRQRGGGGFGGFQGGGAPVSSRDISQYGDMLALDDEQREVVTLLFEVFMEDYQASQDDMRRQMQEARDGGGGFEGMREMMEAANTKREKLQTSFLGDVQAILSPDQQSSWPKVERAMTRNQSLRQGTLSGERVDLVRLVSELELESDAAVAPILNEYEVTLDGELKRRNDLRASMRNRDRGGDPGDAFEKIRAAGERVRDTNRTYARQVESALGTDDGARFAASFARASYPQVYRPGRGQRALEVALGFEDVSADQRASLDSLNQSYTQDTSSLNKKYVAEIDKAERDGTSFGNRQQGRGNRQGGGQDAGGRTRQGGDQGGRPGGADGGRQGGRPQGGQNRGPGSEVAQQKRDLDTKTVERVSDILNEAQSARLNETLQAERDAQRGEGQRGQQRRRDR